MGDVSLEMIWKRLEQLQTGQDAIRAELKDVRAEIADLNETVRAFAKSQISMQRDISRLNDRVTILTAAIDEHPPTHP
ncbi:MAG TPA: hypothetical protein VMF32_10675 [Xanthobacteraceae bacterium]|nr:hypothetical protein [Xanthobacteraceae bacterium]